MAEYVLRGAFCRVTSYETITFRHRVKGGFDNRQQSHRGAEINRDIAACSQKTAPDLFKAYKIQAGTSGQF
jgi:hypothetical protein